MEYTVLIEQRDGAWRALIPALANLGAEGTSRDEALRNAQHVAEVYLSSVEVASITVNRPQESPQPSGHPRKLLQALDTFAGDEEALREHFGEIAKERQRQRKPNSRA